MKLARASEMQQLDRTAIEQYQIPGIVLMENAGRGTVEYMFKKLGPVTGRSVLIFVGPGNNGGDGLVIGRRLHKLGGLPLIVYLVDPQNFKGDAATNYQSVVELNIPGRVILDADDLNSFSMEDDLHGQAKPPWAIVDAVFGTGLQRYLAGHFEAAVHCMNRIREATGCPTVAVDISSGLNADTGQTLGVSVQAD
ncbi:MAG: NAD(P)H-hydrate epimerase, partial [Desulfobulbaceae bacterium]|nr:NAD(P)H-hydrate epimerase [Desulfobulbaceae bacterium]